MAEATTKTIQYVGNTPGAGVDICFVQGTTAVNNDTLTVTGLTTVKGAFLISTTGVAATMTFATNVITITNAGALTWTGLAWGVP